MPRSRTAPPAIARLSVFISSSQREFKRLRQELKENIDSEEMRFSRREIMNAVLIENQRGAVISEDIKRHLDGCSIYVGIFGKKLSEWVVAELREARASGIPLLIYHLKRVTRRGRPTDRQRGRRSNVEAFLDEEVKRFGIRVRGPYRREENILDAILDDLACEIVELTMEATLVRRTIHRSLARQSLQP
jgi:hypothetical protein